MMSKKKNVSKKKHCVLRNRRINQAGGSSEVIVRNTIGNDNENVSIVSELLRTVEPEWKAEAGRTLTGKYTPAQIEAIVKLIVFEAKNALSLNKPVPSILASDHETVSERDTFIKTVTDTDHDAKATEVAKNLINATTDLTVIQRNVNEFNKKVLLPLSPPPIEVKKANDKIVELTEAEYKALSTKLEQVNGESLREIDGVAVNLHDLIEKILIVPDVTPDNDISCSDGIFKPVDKLSLVVSETDKAPLDDCLKQFNSKLNSAANQIFDGRKSLMLTNGGVGDSIPMFISPTPPSPPPPSSNPTPISTTSTSSHSPDSLIVKRGTLKHLSEIMGGQIAILSKWMKSLAISGLYKFKDALKKLFSSLLKLLDDTFPILTLIGRIILQHFIRSMTSYATFCGFVITSVARTSASAMNQMLEYEVASKPPGMTDEEFTSLCQEYNKANGDKDYFFIQGDKIVCKLVVMNATNTSKDIATSFKKFCENMQTFGSRIAESTSVGMGKLLTSMKNAKDKYTKIMDVFIAKHLSKEEMAVLYKSGVTFFSDVGASVTTARNSFMQNYYTDNQEYITKCKDNAAEAVTNIRGKMTDALKNSSDYVLISVILLSDQTGKFSIGNLLRAHSFKAGILTQQGYINSLESTNSTLNSMYTALKTENEALMAELRENPLLRTKKYVDKFLDKVFEEGESSLVREAKKQRLMLVSQVASRDAVAIYEIVASLALKTEKNTAMDEFNKYYKDQKKDPNGDLLRLFGMLWDLDAIENAINPPTVDMMTMTKNHLLYGIQPFTMPIATLFSKAKQFIFKKKQTNTIEVGRCDSIISSDTGIAATAKKVANSDIMKILLAAGITFAQSYLLMTIGKAAATSKSVQPLKSLAIPVGTYYALAQTVAWFKKKREETFPMCMILKCENEANVNLPIDMMSDVSTIFLDVNVSGTGTNKTFTATVKSSTWLQNFNTSLDDDEKAKILMTVQTLRTTILDTICSSEEYYSRRSNIFMDEAFGTNGLAIKKVYSGHSDQEATLDNILSITANDSFKLEYRFWMLLKGMQIKSTQQPKSKSPPGTFQKAEIQATTQLRPADEYLEKINIKYHDNINARIDAIVNERARQDDERKVAQRDANSLKIALITQIIDGLEKDVSENEELISRLKEYLKGLETVDNNDEINRLEQAAITLIGKHVQPQRGAVEASRTSSDSLIELLTKLKEAGYVSDAASKAQASEDALNAVKAQAEAEKLAVKAQAEAETLAVKAQAEAAEAKLAEVERKLKEAQKTAKMELISRILKKIDQCDEFLKDMLTDLNKTVSDFNKDQTRGIEFFKELDPEFYARLNAFIAVAGGVVTDKVEYEALSKLEEIEYALTSKSHTLLATMMLSPPMKHAVVRDKKQGLPITMKDVIERMNSPLQKCKTYFETLQQLVKAKGGDIELTHMISDSPFSTHSELIRSFAATKGGSKRKNRLSGNSRRKRNRINVYATKKISYLRRHNKIKMSVNRRKRKYRK